jgi:sec-independent protein translocase protein TatC
MTSTDDTTKAIASGDEILPRGGKIMTLTEHLGELQDRLLKCFLAIIVFFVLGTIFTKEIIEFIKIPLVDVLPAGANSLHFTGPMDVFMVGMKLAFLVSIIASCPVWIYNFWRFIEPALYENERKWILPFIFASSGLFLSGVAFCYILVFPMTLEFMIGFGSEVATSIITINDYVSLLMFLIFAFGFVFQTPLVLIMLALLGLIEVELLSKNRRIVVIICLTVAALITPPDPVSQVSLAIPMYIMFEASILIIRYIQRNDKKAE